MDASPTCHTMLNGADEPLFGREVEHGGIVRFLQQRLAMEHSKVLLLCGPCGVGKSSTITRVLRLPAASGSANGRGAAVWASPSLPQQVDVPAGRMQAIADMAQTSSQAPQPSVGRTKKVAATTIATRRSSGGGDAIGHTPASGDHMSIRRDLRSYYINCTDLSASDLVNGIVERFAHGQRTTDVLRAKIALLELVGDRKSFDTKLDAALDAHYHPRVPTKPEALERCPLHVFVLDEADAAKRGATVALRNLVQLVLKCPLWFTLVCVSNERWLNFLPADDDATVGAASVRRPLAPRSHSEFSNVRVVTFAAYEADVLKRIGELAVLERHRSAPSASSSIGTTVASSAALAFAAKSVVLHHCGDARKVKELCCRAADEASMRAASTPDTCGIGGIRDVSNRCPPTDGKGNAMPRSSTKKRARSPPASTAAANTTVTLRDVFEAAKDPLRPDASCLVLHLPELTTYVLCCIVVAARRQVVADYVRRTSIGGSKSIGAAKDAAVQHTNEIAIRDCGDMSEHEVYRLYAALMLRMMFPMCTREAVTRSLEDLAARRVITNKVSRFVCTGEWSLAELEAALVDKGTELVRREAELLGDDKERAALLTNRFTTALHELATAC